MMKMQRFVLSLAVALAAFGAGVGLIEFGNHVRTAFVSPRSGAQIEIPLPPQYATPVRVGPVTEFKPRPVEPKAEPAEEHEFEWGVTGDYYFAGKNPFGFEGFDSLAVVTREWSYEKERIVSVKPYGSLQSYEKNKIASIYRFSFININGTRISIVTESVKGVSYQFDGKFVDEKFEYKNAAGMRISKDISLKGRLTKWKDGKRIAEAKVNFEIGGC